VVATFSIAACDTADSIWGVAVASKFLAVGSVVPWARAGTGAVATQAFCNTTFGPRGLDLLERGLLPDEVLTVLLRSDAQRARRQVGLVDAHGRAATYTGDSCMAWAGGKTGSGYAAQGNILAGSEVVDAVASTFEATAGFLGDRLLAALDAGDAAGGDSRGRQSAALLLVSPGKGYGGFNDVLCDLRVDDHPEPFRELRRIYGVWREQHLITEGYRLVEEGRYMEAIALGEEAVRRDPDSGEPYYHLACYQARAGNADAALRSLAEAVRRDASLKNNAEKDPDLTSLRRMDRYKEILAR